MVAHLQGSCQLKTSRLNCVFPSFLSMLYWLWHLLPVFADCGAPGETGNSGYYLNLLLWLLLLLLLRMRNDV